MSNEILCHQPVLTSSPSPDSGQIRSAIGLAHLLVNQRFKQFSGLIKNCEEKTTPKGETQFSMFHVPVVPLTCCFLYQLTHMSVSRDAVVTVTPDDLQGFWDMVSYQVEDIYVRFNDLTPIKKELAQHNN